MTSGIYGIQDQLSNWIVYVGRGFDINHRFKQHCKDGRTALAKARRLGWFDYPVTRTKENCLAYLLFTQRPFELILLEELPEDRLIQDGRERAWCKQLIAQGHPLSNGNSSGTYLTFGLKTSCPYTSALPTAQAGDFQNRPFWISSSKRVIPLCELR